MSEEWVPKNYQEHMLRDLVAWSTPALPAHGRNEWAEMGLGKTVTTATALQDWMDSGDLGRALVWAPLRVATSTWPRELRKWRHLKGLPFRVIHGGIPMRERAQMLDERFEGVEIVNYDIMKWLVREWWRNSKYYKTREMPWQAIVFDESSKLKSSSTERYRALRRLINTIRDGSTRVLNLTGTPAPAGYLGLWSQTYLLDHGQRLGSTYPAYRERYFDSDFMGWKYELREGARTAIDTALGDITSALLAEDYLDMPPLVVNDIPVQLPNRCRELYRKLEDEMFLVLASGNVEVANGGVLTGKTGQLANGALYVDGRQDKWETVHDEKLQVLDDIVEEAEGENILVVYRFKSDLARILKRYKRAVDLKQYPDIEGTWSGMADTGAIGCIHPMSCGHGLNMQEGGRIIVFYGVPWSFDQYKQVMDRIAGGLRRTRPTMVHRILCVNTVDYDMVTALAEHCSVQEVLMRRMRRAA